MIVEYLLQDNPQVPSTVTRLCKGGKREKNPVYHFARLTCRNFVFWLFHPVFCLFPHYRVWSQAMTT